MYNVHGQPRGPFQGATAGSIERCCLRPAHKIKSDPKSPRVGVLPSHATNVTDAHEEIFGAEKRRSHTFLVVGQTSPTPRNFQDAVQQPNPSDSVTSARIASPQSWF